MAGFPGETGQKFQGVDVQRVVGPGFAVHGQGLVGEAGCLVGFAEGCGDEAEAAEDHAGPLSGAVLLVEGQSLFQAGADGGWFMAP